MSACFSGLLAADLDCAMDGRAASPLRSAGTKRGFVAFAGAAGVAETSDDSVRHVVRRARTAPTGAGGAGAMDDIDMCARIGRCTLVSSPGAGRGASDEHEQYLMVHGTPCNVSRDLPAALVTYIQALIASLDEDFSTDRARCPELDIPFIILVARFAMNNGEDIRLVQPLVQLWVNRLFALPDGFFAVLPQSVGIADLTLTSDGDENRWALDVLSKRVTYNQFMAGHRSAWVSQMPLFSVVRDPERAEEFFVMTGSQRSVGVIDVVRDLKVAGNCVLEVPNIVVGASRMTVMIWNFKLGDSSL